MQYIKALWKLNYIASMKLLTLISSKLVIKLTLEPKFFKNCLQTRIKHQETR